MEPSQGEAAMSPAIRVNRESEQCLDAKCVFGTGCLLPTRLGAPESAHPQNQMSLSAKSSHRVESSYESSTCCYAVAEVIKQRHAVRLGPHAHCARAGDVVVVHLDVGLAVEDNADPLARELHAQRVPGVAGNRRIDVFQRVAPSVRRVIERYVVLQRIGARDVVVVTVLPGPHEAPPLVLTPG